MNRKVGQLFMVGFEGTHTTPEFRSFVDDEDIGGVVLFRRNVDSRNQLMRLTGRLQEEAGELPMLIAIDQEGGRVQRLPKSFGAFPSMAQIGRAAREADDPNVAYEAGARIAGVLKPLGINMDFAPVLDVATNSYNPIIGDRAFGEDAAFVAQLGVEFISGLMEGGVLACGKHFPGHGDTDVDSHLELPVLQHSKRRFEVCEWQPFRAAIEEGVPAIMTTHLFAPNLDPKNMATVSHTITTRMLRGELGFDGIIVTDDLIMDGIAKQMSIGEAAVRSINAGADIVLICQDMAKQREAIDAVKRAVDAGWISERRIDASLARLTKIKKLNNR